MGSFGQVSQIKFWWYTSRAKILNGKVQFFAFEKAWKIFEKDFIRFYTIGFLKEELEFLSHELPVHKEFLVFPLNMTGFIKKLINYLNKIQM